MKQGEWLIVDDDPLFCRVLARALERRGQLGVRQARSLAEARQALGESAPDYLVLDLRIEDESGLQLIEEALARAPRMDIVVLTGFASLATAVEAIKRGARDYLAKPADAHEIMVAFGLEELDPDAEPEPHPPSVRKLEWEHIQRVLQQHDGNISATARALNMHRRTLQRKLQKKPVKK